MIRGLLLDLSALISIGLLIASLAVWRLCL
jgi:hypothetical protein